jgi:hypothetical protein
MSSTASPAAWELAAADAHEAIAEALEHTIAALVTARDAVQPLLRPKIGQTIAELRAEVERNEEAASKLRRRAA